jgi:hypothetical protein
MQRCPHCGAPNAAPTCWHCGHEAAAGDHLPVEARAAIVRRGISTQLLIGAVAAGLFITLSVVIVASRLSRPAGAPVSASQAAPVRSPDSERPSSVEQTLLPSWVGRRQAVWGPDGTKTVSFALDAVADVTVSSRTRPQLVARCLSRATDVYVVTGPLSFERQAGTHTVRVQVDGDPELSQQWMDSQGSHELFAPDGVGLTDRLARAHRLRLGFTPFNAKPVTAEFIVEGFDQIAPLVARTCGRRPSLPVQ